MKKMIALFLILCITVSVAACNNGADPIVDDTADKTLSKIDPDDVDAIIIQPDNAGQYFLSADDIDQFAELYNQPEVLVIADGENATDEYAVVVTYKNGDYLNLYTAEDSEYDFICSEYQDVESMNTASKYLVKNASLAKFIDNLINEKFPANS